MLSKIIITALIISSLTSCGHKKKEFKQGIAMTKISIPMIELNRNDPSFSISNGVLLLDNSPYSGLVIEFYPNNIVKSKSEYYLGRRHGYYSGWYPNGNKWFDRFYSYGIKTGSHIGWFEDNQQMFAYEFNTKGMYHGAVKDWYNNGQLAKHFNFENGKEAGSQRMWELDGSIRANFFTVKGERHGLIGLKNCGSVISIEKE